MAKAEQRDVLLYWSPKTADQVLKHEDDLKYAASNQFWRISPGDIVWIVTVYEGELFLLNKLHVGEITDRPGAIKRLGEKDVWGNKDFYAIATAGMIEPLQKISLRDVARNLVFKSANDQSRRLTLDREGKVNAQQLQTMRILESSSIDLLEKLWQV